MKKLLILSGLFFGLFAQAQNEKSLLWKISGNELKEPSYLYGTIHITCDATLDKPTLNALEKTSQLYLELDMDDTGLQMAMMQGMMMKDGKTNWRATELIFYDLAPRIYFKEFKVLSQLLQII